jgi:hypothetical protein
MQREGKKQNLARRAKKIPDFFLNVVEITAAVEGGVADQKNTQGRLHRYRYNTAE